MYIKPNQIWISLDSQTLQLEVTIQYCFLVSGPTDDTKNPLSVNEINK